MSASAAKWLLASVIVARSSSFLFSKFMLVSMNPFELLGLRFLLAFAFLLLVYRKRVMRTFSWDMVRKKAILGITLALGMAAVLAFGAAGCGGGTDAKTDDTALEDFNIVLDWYPNAIHSFLYVAQEKGYFADEGLNLVINFPANTNDGISMPAAGKADIGIYYLQDAIQTAVEENVPIVSVGAVTQSSLNVVISLAKSGCGGFGRQENRL